MTTIARPGTPFPHTHSISHSPVASSSMQYRYSAQPIHFQRRALPSPTPPSLLKRSSSQGSSSGYMSASPRTPPLDARRPSAVSLASSASPVMPTTPRMSLCAESEVPSFELASEEQDEQPAELDFPKMLARGRSDYLPPAPPSTPVEVVRPKLKRRDTPRPTPCIASLAVYAPRPRLQRGKALTPPASSSSIYPSSAGAYAEDGPAAKRKYTSVIDGGHWVILDH